MFAIRTNRRGRRPAAAAYYSRRVAEDDFVTNFQAPTDEPPQEAPPQGRRRGVAVNTAIFSILTGASRVAGLGREVLASSYFATSGAFSAFTIAFQLPNLVRSLFADAALSAAFVPVFTEMIEKGEKKEAVRLASTLFFVILAVLGGACLVFILGAHTLVPLFTGGQFSHHLDELTAGLSQV